jgi:hypothetical protein
LLAARGLRALAGDLSGSAGSSRPRLPAVLALASGLLLVDLCLFADLPGQGACALPSVAGLDRAPAIYDRLPGSGALLDLPPRMMDDDARGRYLVWQRHHRRPVPYALLMTGLSEPLATEPLVAAMAALDRRDPISRRPEQAAQFRRADLALAAQAYLGGDTGVADLRGAHRRLREQGFDAVVLHGHLMHPDDAAAATSLLWDLLGEPSVEVDGSLAWELGVTP